MTVWREKETEREKLWLHCEVGYSFFWERGLNLDDINDCDLMEKNFETLDITVNSTLNSLSLERRRGFVIFTGIYKGSHF